MHGDILSFWSSRSGGEGYALSEATLSCKPSDLMKAESFSTSSFNSRINWSGGEGGEGEREEGEEGREGEEEREEREERRREGREGGEERGMKRRGKGREREEGKGEKNHRELLTQIPHPD